MNSYTVFDPDDGSGRTYWWYGGTTVYVHQDGTEVDAFELEHSESAVGLDQVRAAVVERHAAPPD